MPQAYSAPDAILATYAYAVQIFCDFSGYTDIAIGLALLMGFVFPQNFDRPYRAASFGEFWRRWHMTLSRFLRDFLYIPLGGNRKGKLKTVAQPHDHDAARRPVARRGVGLRAVGRRSTASRSSIEHQFRGKVRAAASRLAWFLVFNIVCLAWIPFRAPDLDLAGAFVSRFADWGPATLWTAPIVIVTFLVIGAAAAAGAADGRAARALRGAASGRARGEHGVRHRARGRDGVQPGRATVHLLLF